MSPASEFPTDQRTRKRWQREVTLYRGDEIIASGTIEQLAKDRGVTCEYIEWLTTPTAAWRAQGRIHLIGVRTD